MGGGRGRIVNGGTIQSTHGPRAAIVLRGNGKTLINSGRISAAGSAAVRFVSAPGSVGFLVNQPGGLIRSARGMAISKAKKP